MKKIVLCAVLATAAISPLTSATAVAANKFCVGGVAGESSVSAGFGTDKFVKITFKPKCSANVFLEGNDINTSTYGVGAASAKGKSKFVGTTNGGSLTGTACETDPCKTADATAPTS